MNHILFDIGNRQGESGAVKDALVTYTDDGRVEGWVITEPEYVKKYQPGTTVPLYFSAVLDKRPDAVGAFNGTKRTDGARQAKGVGAGLYLTYRFGQPEQVTAKVGLSYTSVENARLNLEREASALTFDEAKATAIATWEDYLGRIRVETDRRDDMVKFYTGLYHALLGEPILVTTVRSDNCRLTRTVSRSIISIIPMRPGEHNGIWRSFGHWPIRNT